MRKIKVGDKIIVKYNKIIEAGLTSHFEKDKIYTIEQLEYNDYSRRKRYIVEGVRIWLYDNEFILAKNTNSNVY